MSTIQVDTKTGRQVMAVGIVVLIALTTMVGTVLLRRASAPTADFAPAESVVETPRIATSSYQTDRVDAGMSAVAALANGKPSLFFYPVQVCQMRYCVTADFLAAKMGDELRDRI
jgi:hypothetical protein